MRRLLFLNGIKAFEAAARSGSFAGAGAELNVSAAAVSRMVHLLEERLGVVLFERKANKLAMTSAGRAYQSGLTPIFDALASLTAQVTAPSSVRVLTVGVGPTPMVSTRTLDGAVTCAVRLASASKIGVSPF